MTNRPPSWGRRKFLRAGVRASFMLSVLPLMKVFGWTGLSENRLRKAEDPFLDIVEQYGAEFGGKEAFFKTCIKRGGQHGRL